MVVAYAGLHPRGIGSHVRLIIDQYKVPTVAGAPLNITKKYVLQRLRARVTEEAFQVPELHELHDGELVAGVLGYVQEQHIVLSAAVGSAASVCRRTQATLTGDAPALYHWGHNTPTCFSTARSGTNRAQLLAAL